MSDDKNRSSLAPGCSPASLDPAAVGLLEAAVRLGEAAKALLAAQARTELGQELGAIDAKWIAIQELEQELRAIDAKWRSQVSEEAKLALGKELKAIDAKWRSQVSEEAKLALGKELRAMDAKWRPQVSEEASAELANLAAQFLAAAKKCGQLGVIGEQATPSTDIIGVVAQSVIGANTQQSI